MTSIPNLLKLEINWLSWTSRLRGAVRAPRCGAQRYRRVTDVVFLKVDVDKNDEIADKYSVSAMPTFLFIKNKEKRDSLEGANEAKLRDYIQKYK